MEIDGLAQPDLVPLPGNKFGLKGVSGFTLVFLVDAVGAAMGR